jgi:outer membrane protein assembly factor BamB
MIRVRQVACAAALLAATAAHAVDVTLAFVPGGDEAGQSLEALQVVYKSPFDGWLVTAWPFGLKVDEEPIMGFQTSREKLLDLNTGDHKDEAQKVVDSMLNKIDGGKKVSTPSLSSLIYRLDRKAVVRINLEPRQHTIQPFGIAFTVDYDGSLTCDDPRARVNKAEKRLEVVCHPVVFRSSAGPFSVTKGLAIVYNNKSLFGQLNTVLSEFQADAAKAATFVPSYMKLVAYLPASLPDKSYTVNDVTFQVGANGKVSLAAGAGENVVCADGRTIQFNSPPPRPRVPAQTRSIGVRWLKAGHRAQIVSGKTIVDCGKPSGSCALELSATGSPQVMFGAQVATLPAAAPDFPHALAIWDGAAKTVWLVETSALDYRPGGAFRCRIKRLAGAGAALPGALRIALEAVNGGAAGGEMSLAGEAGGVYAGTLPVQAGFWRLRASDAGPLQGQTLGLALVADKTPAGVTLFRVNNRGLFRRGDTFDLLWLARRTDGAVAGWPVRLRGMGLDVVLARIEAPAGAPGALNGSIRVDTTALAPGSYQLAVEADGVAGYPFRFNVCQRETLTDYEIYSFAPVAVPNDPYPGSPVHTYKNHPVKGPGLAPYRADGDGSLDAGFAAYADAPLGPARDAFARPTAEELDLMATAAMGKHSAPGYPTTIHAETENPKHTLPEDLAEMRRRMALYMQQHADYPGIDGFGLGWYANRNGFWENSPQIDGRQNRRNQEMSRRVKVLLDKEMADYKVKYKDVKMSDLQWGSLYRWKNWCAFGSVLPTAFGEWFVDAYQIRSGLTLHNAAPSFWLGGWHAYCPASYATLTHRDSLDYTDYCISPWANFRAPAFLNMGNPRKQKTSVAFYTHNWRSELVATAFGAAGRGLDGLAITMGMDDDQSENLLRLFERFGSWFTALEPLPDVAVYFNDNPNRASVALHDLARMRRPGMLLSPEDALAGELSKYKVLMLTGLDAFELPEIDQAVRDFEARGGVIIKDDACKEGVPGRKLGFAYDGNHVHGGWGLGGPNGEWEFAHLWDNFKKTREAFLIKAFAQTPGIPVATPDASVILSPLAGKDSILCFVINKTEVPLEMKGRWRQGHVLPCVGELLVEKGWHIRDVLTGKDAPVETTAQGQRVRVDFTRFEGALYLLTKREPAAMAIKTERAAPNRLILTAWLADGKAAPFADPMPFEVSLVGKDGVTLFHKFAACSPDLALDIPVPALAAGNSLELRVCDLVLGTMATQTITPAAPEILAARVEPDIIGGPGPVKAFLSERKGPVTVMLDEGQQEYLSVAERVAALVKKSGRDARVSLLDATEVRPLVLRWIPLDYDLRVYESLTNRNAWAWRVPLKSLFPEGLSTADPSVGHDEIGPRMRHDRDVILIGSPANNRAIADLEPFLRRTVTAAYPSAGGFFIHHLWNPFEGGYNGLYLGCRDVAGAEAALACLAAVEPPAVVAQAKSAAKSVETRGGASKPLKNLLESNFGNSIIDVAFAPSGKRLFVTTAGYAEWFFVLSPAGEIMEKRLLPVRSDFPNWWNWARHLRVVSDTSLYLKLTDSEYLYDLDKGFISKAAASPQHYLPGPGDGGGPIVRGSTLLEDPVGGRLFLGGNDRVQGIDKEGNLLFQFEDGDITDMIFPRGVFPRAVSGDGRVLLVSAFGVQQALYATGLKNPSIYGIDIATGKLLWDRKGIFLSAGKAVAQQDRFVVVADDGATYEILAATGKDGNSMDALTGSADWMIRIPEGDALLIVENNHFDRQGKTSRVYLRSDKDGSDRDLPVPGRVRVAMRAPDNQSFLVTTAAGQTLRFANDGTLLWKSETPAGHLVRFSPDGKMIVVGGADGRVRWLDGASGATTQVVDFNSYNTITPERFVKQEFMGDVPQVASRSAKPQPPAASYLTAFNPAKLAFGPNQAPPEKMKTLLAAAEPAAADPAKPGYVGKLAKPVMVTIQAEAGKTYFVEMLSAIANPADFKPTLRLEVSVTAKSASKNLPFVARLPLNRFLARHRTAFRADAAGELTLTLRAVLPRQEASGKKTVFTYANVPASEIPALVGDLVVSELKFPGSNVLFDGGPASGSQPAASPICTVYPWQDGTNQEKIPYTVPSASLRMVNGQLVNQDIVWAGARGVEYTDIRIPFKKGRKLSAVAIYEDVSGPRVTGDLVTEILSSRYFISVRNADTKQWVPLGRVINNQQAINIFACPDFNIDEILYVWAGKQDAVYKQMTDGSVRIAQFEVYGAEDVSDMIINQMEKGKPEILDLPEL